MDEDDGQIDRVLPVASREDILRFQVLFFDKARRKLFDDHLWFSVVGRPTRSNFTRLQRLTCILCLLYTTMLANAMWYGRVEVANDKILEIGSITISAATILVSVFGSLTVVPINTIIVTLFRKHRPKEWPADDEVIGLNGERIKVQRDGATTKRRKWWKKKYPLPYWCAYIAWALAILSSLTGMLFIILYSLQWGKEKADKWLSSLLISTVQSVLLVQPVKVRLQYRSLALSPLVSLSLSLFRPLYFASVVHQLLSMYYIFTQVVVIAAAMAIVMKALEDDEDDVGVRFSNATLCQDEEFTDEYLIRLSTLEKIA